MHSTDPRGALVPMHAGTEPVSYGYAYGLDLPITARATLAGPALYQLKAAQTGRWLTDYRSAENVGQFTIAVTTNADAYLKAAYWLAIAAQINPTGRSNIINIAQRYYALGAGLAFKGDTSSDAVIRILQDGARELSAYAGNSSVRGIVNFLNDMGQSDVILKRTQEDPNASWWDKLSGPAAQYIWIGTGVFLFALILLARRRAQSRVAASVQASE